MEINGKSSLLDFDFFEDLTTDIAAPAGRDVEAIGARIRALRQQKGVEIEELSKLTGFEADLLSGIEENRVQPKLGTLVRLSKALDNAFGRLDSGAGDRLYSITRKHERKNSARAMTRAGRKHLYSYKSLTPGVKGHHMEALVVQLLVSQDREMSVHEGEEFVFVLDGTVLFEIGGDCFNLEPGDSVYYLSTTPHLISAKEGKATILAVIYGT